MVDEMLQGSWGWPNSLHKPLQGSLITPLSSGFHFGDLCFGSLKYNFGRIK